MKYSKISQGNKFVPIISRKEWSKYSLASNDDEQNKHCESGESDESWNDDIEVMMPEFYHPASHSIIDTGKLFDLWCYSTNFYLTDPMFEKLAQVEGVDTIDPIAPYKCRIGVAELFDDCEVHQRVVRVMMDCLREQKKIK